MSFKKSLVLVVISQLLLVVPAFGKYTFDEKIDLLYKVSPDKSSDKIKTDLREFIDDLRTYNHLSAQKRLKKIFGATKSRYLHTYKLSTFFPEISSYGTYNCMTGTALFAIIFDELDIPYTVVEVPQHVYMVAFPKTEKIAVESTNLKDGLYQWTEYNKQSAINFLLTIQKITEYDLRVNGVDGTIEKFFFSNSEHDFDGLLGMHFMNRAMYFSDKENFTEAFEQVYMAHNLYNGPMIKYLEGYILQNLVDKTAYDDIKIVHYLTCYYELTDFKPERQRTQGNFAYTIQQALTNRRDIAFVDSAEILVRQNLEEADENLFLSEIEESRAVWNYNRGKKKEALNHAKLGYSYNPANKNFEDIITSILLEELYDEDFYYDSDIPLIEEKLLEIQLQYPFIKEQPSYINFYVVLYAELTSEFFFSNEPEEGFICLEKTKLYESHPDLDKEQYDLALSGAYGKIAAYYFREELYQDAMTWILKALELEPDSKEHQSKRDYIQSKM